MKLAPAASDSAPAPPDQRRHRSRQYAVAIVLLGVVLVAIAFRFVTKSDLWLDEALTVNVAKLPLGDLRGALERDGAPPLYYVLLHGWIRAFGTTDVAVRALSGVLGVAMLPLA